MDPVNLTFYAAVCGTLAAYAPSFGSRATRAAVGVIVGVIASSLLPFLKSIAGF